MAWVIGYQRGIVFFYVESPESRTQVYMYQEGVLKVHNNVEFEANTAGDFGGAVSLPFAPFSFLSALVSCDRISESWFDPLRQLSKPRRKDWWLSSSHVCHSFPTSSLPHAGLHAH